VTSFFRTAAAVQVTLKAYIHTLQHADALYVTACCTHGAFCTLAAGAAAAAAAVTAHLNSDSRSCSFLIAWLRVMYCTAFPAFPRFCFFPMLAQLCDCTTDSAAVTRDQHKDTSLDTSSAMNKRGPLAPQVRVYPPVLATAMSLLTCPNGLVNKLPDVQ
jgi:hypothetical protein